MNTDADQKDIFSIDLMCVQALSVIAEFINRSAAQHLRRWHEAFPPYEGEIK